MRAGSALVPTSEDRPETAGSAGHLTVAAAAFRRVLEHARTRAGDSNWDWYPYNSLQNIAHIESLLSRSSHTLGDLLMWGAVLDIGCADGELAFFFESLGANVVAVDHPKSNYNGMRGVRALKQATESNVEIRQIDVDDHFDLGTERYGLTCLLGILYHLKNPFMVLEKLSRHAHYCLLSTRVTKFLPDRQTRIAEAPLAYLVDDYELNGDNTNFWIFTEAGLRRILSRSNWAVAEYMSLGPGGSDPHSIENDERAFCLLESRYGVLEAVDLIAGWHAVEESGWRWTMRRFQAKVFQEQRGPARVKLSLYVHDALLQSASAVTLRCSADGEPLAPETYTRPGRYVYERPLNVVGSPVFLAFEVDAVVKSDHDQRELGLIVADLRIVAGE